jgi:hypothetical protein
MTRSARCYCFTVNNPDASAYPAYDPDHVKCLVYQLERGENGTPHLQGYVEFSARRTLSNAKSYPGLERAHLEIRRGSKSSAIAYCVKDAGRIDGPWSYGDIDSSDGKRNELTEFVNAVRGGATRPELFESYPNIFARYPRFIASTFEHFRVASLIVPEFTPRLGWQTELFETLSSTPDPRKILWFYDQQGNAGKSHFALGYPNGYVITGGKHADIYYAYGFERVVFFDWPRDAEERFPYSSAESFKNGYFLSSKYEVKRVRFEVPHVVVFSNFMPDLCKLSLDRWEIKTI